jgi:hypothetical protein
LMATLLTRERGTSPLQKLLCLRVFLKIIKKLKIIFNSVRIN